MRIPWQRNTVQASCCALGWSTSQAWKLFGLLRMGEQFSDKEHNFTSWGEPKCRGVYSELHPVSLSRVTFPFSPPVVPLQLGYSHSQASQKFQIFRRCPSWVQDDFFSSDPSSIIHLSLGASPCCEFQSSKDHGSPFAVSSLVPHLLSLLQMLCRWP